MKIIDNTTIYITFMLILMLFHHYIQATFAKFRTKRLQEFVLVRWILKKPTLLQFAITSKMLLLSVWFVNARNPKIHVRNN